MIPTDGKIIMEKLGTLKLQGASGTIYAFDVYSKDTNWTDGIECIYYVSNRTSKSDGTGNHSHIYVGQTDDLKFRLSNHQRQSCFDSHDYNAISVHGESNERVRLDKESDLIDAMYPPCNQRLTTH